MEALNTAQHKAAEAMYKLGQRGRPAEPRARPAASSRAGGRPEGDVIDAEVVEEEKK